jgi:hypothetical protein
MSESSVVGLVESLHDIADHRKTGVLRLSLNGRFRMVFFEEGDLVYVVSDAPEESLVAYFTRAGRLESAAERLVLFQLEKEVTRKKSLVALVLEQKLRDEETLRAWLADYAYDVFARAFDTADTDARFTGGIEAEHPLPIRIGVPHLILESVHRMQNEGLIRSFVGPLTSYTAPAEGYTGRLTSLPLSFFDGLVASQVNSEAKLDDLLIVTGIPEAEVLKALVALRLTGVIVPFYEKHVTDTDRLRQRQEAVDSGFVVDAEMAAAALHLSASIQSEEDHSGTPITMGEFEGTTPYVPSAPVQRGNSAPLQYPAPRPRGDTGRLKLLASAYIQMGESEAAAGNFAAAVQCFESALSQKPNDLDTLVAYARVLAKRPGGLAAADKALRQASERNPRSVRPLVELARLYHKAGKNDEAEDLLDDARHIEPINAEIRKLTEEIRKNSGGGLLAKFGFRSDAKVKAPPLSKPSSPAKPPPTTSSYAQSPGADLPAHMKCRNCGRPLQGQLRFCRFCGATQ